MADQILTIRVSPADMQALEDIAAQSGTNRHRVSQRMVADWLAAQKGDLPTNVKTPVAV